jgi:hypothetical protein
MVDGYENKNLLWDLSQFKQFNPNYSPPISPPHKKSFFYKGVTGTKKMKKQSTMGTKRKANDSEEPSPVTNSWLLFFKILRDNIDDIQPVKSRKVSLGSPKPTKLNPEMATKKPHQY